MLIMYMKKLVCLMLALVFICNISIAAVVSDNDGAAFITKAEFDSLKNTFQAQLNEINTQIDTKIDNAVAAYITGAKQDKQSDLTSILNKINQGFVDSKTLDWPKSQKGSYYKYFINLGMMAGPWYIQSCQSQIQYLTGDINNPKWKTVGSSSGYGIYYYGTKTTDGYYVMTNYTNSMSYSSLMGVWTTAGGGFNASTTGISLQNKTYTNADNVAFANSNDTWTFTLGGTSQTINVTKSFGIDDTFIVPTLNYVTGNQLIRDDDSNNVDDDVYFLEASNLNVPGQTLVDATTDHLGYEIRKWESGNDTGTTLVSWTTTTNTNTKLRLYHHKYTTIKRNQILNDAATKAASVNVFYYNGLPIFKNIDKKGKVELKLKFSNSSGRQTVFRIKKSAFDNQALPTTGYSTTYNPDNLMIANNGATVTINIPEVAAGETWWIKARPLGNNDMTKPTFITTSQIKLTYE